LDAGSTPASSTIKQKTTTPKGVFVFPDTAGSLLTKSKRKNKKPCKAWWLFSIFRSEAQGSTKLPSLLRTGEGEIGGERKKGRGGDREK